MQRYAISKQRLRQCLCILYYSSILAIPATASFHHIVCTPTLFIQQCHHQYVARNEYIISATASDDDGDDVVDSISKRNQRTGTTSDTTVPQDLHEPAVTTTTRRKWMIGSLLTGLTTASATAASAKVATTALSTSSTELSQRLQTSILQQPTIGKTTYTSVGNDMTVYPSFMEGTWDVTQTLMNVETPIGLQYAGGPNGVLEIATKSIQESKSQIGKPVRLQLRYVPCQPKTSTNIKNPSPSFWTSTTSTTTTSNDNNNNALPPIILEDRLYNTRQRLNQFAGTTVVANVQYADTQSSNQKTMNELFYVDPPTITIGTTPTSETTVPLTTTLTYFKGPAAQKVFVLGHHDVTSIPKQTPDVKDLCASSSSLPTWTGYEYQRSIFALTNGSTAPPITTDTELIYQFTPMMMDCTSTTTATTTETTSTSSITNHNIHHIRGKLRIVGYLNPNDKYYFDVQNRAVTIQDYTLDMERIA